ncbi:phage tail protein [Actinoplanes sp. NPDC023714]|uniref:phage tail protein n=1 Tax=Actinoplanes sp. NPDC023714 TaxID=3154322 RepID=UPI0033ED76B5
MSYPLPNFRFAVTLDPVDAYVPPESPTSPRLVAAGSFTEVTGLTGDLEVLAQPEGGRNDYVHQLPVRYSWGRITLKKGLIRNRTLWDWFRSGLTGSLGARRDGAILLLDPDGRFAVTWEFRAALAAKWIGPALNGQQGAIAVEALEIVHEGLNQIIDTGSS